ncbi:MAG TPA: hypothetical protein VNH11_22320 [Pirellulales bacterium]|nr:hypothetical protein [Pirellulales bacterium]
MSIQYAAFGDVGLDPAAKDDVVWQFGQDQEYVLITSNRNRSGDDSLEATLRQCVTMQSLPVLTISDPERFHRDRAYVENVIESLLDILLDINAYRGTGRLYLP